MSRIKWAKIKLVDKLWVCTECLTRYERRFQAVECAESHNKIIKDSMNTFEKEMRDRVNKGLIK